MTGFRPLPRTIDPIGGDEGHMPIGSKVYYAIKAAIVNGALKPGAAMTEVDLARQLHVSRTPIRDALRALHQERLLVRERGKGYVINIPTEKDTKDIFEIRRIIETAGLAKAAKSKEELSEKLQTLINKARAALKSGNVIELRDINDAFHSAMAERVDNKRLFAYYVSVQAEISRLRLYSIERNDWAHSSLNEHAQMVNLIRAGDIKRAIDLLEQHLVEAEQVLLDRFKETKKNIEPRKGPYQGKVHPRNGKQNAKKGGIRT